MDRADSAVPCPFQTTLQQSVAFWDVDGATLDFSQHAEWIIDRVLQLGQWDDWVALFALYPPQQIRDALRHRRVPDLFWGC